MDRIVTDYGSIPRIPEVIDGTAMFPGGTGLWRGFEPRGPEPDKFPIAPYFALAHNFDKLSGYMKSLRRGGEDLAKSDFWSFLLLYLTGANVHPSECFFTNAVMGLQPDKAQGMLLGGGPLFAEQCQRFLEYQLAATQPKAAIILGDITASLMRQLNVVTQTVQVRHTSSFYSVKNAEKQSELEKQVERIAAVVGRGTMPVQIPNRYRR